ncbi:MAG TPA: serine/threonine-protein kinase [Blastocatellia bacterium]|nr:serine/threonine-protein kinase [Blastocatellia bacterium]
MKYCPKCQQKFDDSLSLCPADGQPLSFPDPYHLVGRVLLEKYRIDALVGIGGMGAVYNAHNLMINRRVAFKILLPNLALGNEKLLNLFQREAETSGQLTHENIVDVKDAGRSPEGLAYIVMEWLEGYTLEEELYAKRRLGFVRVGEILPQIAAALDYAHLRRIVHRDLKPSNIMLVRLEDGREQVKVVDFGIAKVINDNTASPVSRLMGTPHYSSPEQFRIGANIDGRADIYSLGVILFQMLTGQLPFEAETPEAIMLLHRTEPPPPLRLLCPEAPAAIEQLVERMLAKEAQFRPRTATEAAEVFERALNSTDQARTAQVTQVVTKEGGPVITSGRSESELPAPHVRSTQIEESPITSGRVTTPVLPDPTRDQPTHKTHEAHETYKPYKPHLKLIAVVAAALLLYFIVPPIYQKFRRVSAPAVARELMAYKLEILSADGQSAKPGSGETRLAKGESFKLRFTPRQNGYLYIVAPDHENNPATFLTARPDAEWGVRSNQLVEGTDFSFPPHPDIWLEFNKGEAKMDFTLIFSSAPLPAPGFLAAPPRRKLNADEQSELTGLRDQSIKSWKIEISPDADNSVSRIMLTEVEASPGRPTVVDLTVKRQ